MFFLISDSERKAQTDQLAARVALLEARQWVDEKGRKVEEVSVDFDFFGKRHLRHKYANP